MFYPEKENTIFFARKLCCSFGERKAFDNITLVFVALFHVLLTFEKE